MQIFSKVIGLIYHVKVNVCSVHLLFKSLGVLPQNSIKDMGHPQSASTVQAER